MDITITVSGLRKIIGNAVRQVQHTGDRILIYRYGAPVAALVPFDDLEKLESIARGPGAKGPWSDGPRGMEQELARVTPTGGA